jgi:hypothetical protein
VGLSDVLARSAARHAHALVVEVPGWWRTRAAVERAVLVRGWRLAFSPADADVLVVCGEPGPRFDEAVDLVWHQIPGPRVRIDVREYDDVAARLDESYARLLDTEHHRHDARHRPVASDLLGEASEDTGMDHSGHGDMQHNGHGDMDHGDMDHAGHESHGDMDMSPGGIPLAQGGEDRDGLEMDILKVRLGPVLPHWPAGLVLHCSLQGDVVTTAHAEVVDTIQHHDADPQHPARRLDNIASVLALAGWDDAAAEARRIRDAALGLSGEAADGNRLARLRRKVRRSRLLRWSLRGLRPLSEGEVHRHCLPSDATGDAYDRLIRMLDRAGVRASGDRPAEPFDGRPVRHQVGERAPAYSTDHLAHLVTGLDLATARLVLAGLDIHDLRAVPAEHEVSHD